MIVGMQLRAVHGEVKVSLSLQRKYGVVGRHLGLGKGGEALVFPVRIDFGGLARALSSEVAAAAGVYANAHRGVAHPWLVVGCFAVIVALRRMVLALHLNGIGIVLAAVAQIYKVLVAPIDHHGAHHLGVALVVLNDGGEHEGLVGTHLQAVHHHAPFHNEQPRGRFDFHVLRTHTSLSRTFGSLHTDGQHEEQGKEDEYLFC